MSDASLAQRIRDASVYELSIAYCDFVGLTWLWWPLGRMPYNDARQLRDVVEEIASMPKCNRLLSGCWRELRRISNPKLQKVLATIPEAQEAISEQHD